MKKIVTFLSAVGLLTTSTLSVTACGIGNGTQITINVPNAPKKADAGQDPTVLTPAGQDYFYNDKYLYSQLDVNYVLAVAAQLLVDKIKNDNGQTFNAGRWPEFYKSQAWTDGNFASFNYDLAAGVLTGNEHEFTFKGANSQDLFSLIKNNDASVDDNKIRAYWFTTSEKPWSAAKPGDYVPTQNTIVVPQLSEFDDKNTTITKNGYIHLYVTMADFTINFSAKLDFDFNKLVDKNGIPLVGLNADTFQKPFGDITFKNPDLTRISDVDLT